MNLNAFSRRDLQNFNALLQEAEASGITDFRFLRQKVYNKLSELRKSKEGIIYRDKTKYKVCPSCKRNTFKKSITGKEEGLLIYTCIVCRYSEIK